MRLVVPSQQISSFLQNVTTFLCRVNRDGISHVSKERWAEAQRYEHRTWMEGRATLTDRNEEHEANFARYHALEGLHFRCAIELGCGPFTNMRKILRSCRCDSIDLLDPLGAAYLEHPFCRYKGRRLGGILKTSIFPYSRRGGIKHPLRFLRHKAEEWKIGGFFGRPIKLHATPLEDFKPNRTYDLCVMINVIEHCQDASQLFARILDMTHKGSYFVFADKIYDGQREADLAKLRFDAGHPLRVDHSFIQEFLKLHFQFSLDAKVRAEENGESYLAHYFIGIRISDAPKNP